jgi:hypothetical protein
VKHVFLALATGLAIVAALSAGERVHELNEVLRQASGADRAPIASGS